MNNKLCFLASAAVVWLLASQAQAGGINSDEAMTPNKGGLILRLRGVYADAEASGAIRDADTLKIVSVLAYGLRANLSLFLRTPLRYDEVETTGPGGAGRETHEHLGFEDFTLFIKYRFWQKDASPSDTYRVAWVAGLDVRTGDSQFSSDSYDPLSGFTFTRHHGRHHVNGDAIYQLNTGSGPSGADSLRYDLAYSYRFYPERFTPGHAVQWDIVGEINGEYLTDGSHEVFLSPGVQYSLHRWRFETSLQLPVLQDLSPGRPEANYRVVTGFQYHW